MLSAPLPRPTGTRSGFALVIALSLMAFVLLLLVSITAFVRIESQSAGISLAQLKARQNALLSLQVALGELQSVAGPDRRSVARAELMARDFRVNISLDEVRKWWVGVSHSDGSSGIGADGQAVRWLVSGLDANRTAAQQLTEPLVEPVVLFGENSLDLDVLSGGEPLRAGRIFVDQGGRSGGAFAWLIDDESVKAKLRPADPAVDNAVPDAKLANQRHVLPGYFDLSSLSAGAELAAFTGTAATLARSTALAELQMQGVDAAVVKRRFFDYSLHGFGVLADSRNGGLKRDLTAAFEREAVFDDLFPDQSEPPYIAMDADKFDSAAAVDLRDNGYIHFDIFRDYYNLKDIANDTNILDPTVFEKHWTMFSPTTSVANVRRGTVAPHGFETEGHPYGDYKVWSGRLNNDSPGTRTIGADSYKHNPIAPVFSFMQQAARVWYDDGYENTGTESAPVWVQNTSNTTLQSQVQFWAGLYNPYNISLNLAGTPPPSSERGEGPRFIEFPQVRFSLWQNKAHEPANNLIRETDPSSPNLGAGLGLRAQKLQVHARNSQVLKPGESQLFGFSDSMSFDLVIDDKSEFSSDIASAVSNYAFRDFKNSGGNKLTMPDVRPDNPADSPDEFRYLADLRVEFFNLSHLWSAAGLPYHPEYDDNENNLELFQVLWMPIAEDPIYPAVPIRTAGPLNQPRAGVVFNREDFQLPRPSDPFPEQLELFGYRFRLRTSREPDTQLRPLVDANIRPMWGNPRWDSPLNLKSLASHRVDKFDGGTPNPPLDAEGEKGFLKWGPSIEDSGQRKVILFDIPREPLVSLGQLQHASAGRFSYEPSYIVGNSYSNIRFSDLDSWSVSISDTFSSRVEITPNYEISGDFRLFDASYLVNEALFDGYAFTTIPQAASAGELADYLSRIGLLPNPRYLAHEPEGLAFNQDTLQDASGGHHNAGFVLADGAFNINSTSVAAWEGFLSGTKGLPYRRMDANGGVAGFDPVDGVRFPRVQTILGEPWENSPDDNYWIGFRSLTAAEVRELAEAIVAKILERGPFHTLSAFINRPLEDSEAGKSGVLQAALDATVNKDLPGGYESDADSDSFSQIAEDSTQGAGFPGQLLQGDILQALAPYMQSRSDTFRVRAYGETLHPVTGRPEGRAWCEAIVQRLPDPIQTDLAGTALDELKQPSSIFGRQFRIVSIRWLGEDEV